MKSFKFIKHSKVWFSISLLVILVGAGAMVNNYNVFGSPLRLGIDFTGGTVMELSFEGGKQVDRNQLEQAFESVYPESIDQITFTNESTYIVQSKEINQEQLAAIDGALNQSFGEFERPRFNTIGPKVSETLLSKGFWSLMVAFVAIVLYIAYAFRHVPKRVSTFKFGFSALIALVHDVLITLSVFALFRFEINLFFITALLAVIGFSVNDTIVTFDRIRENLKDQTRNQTFADIADISLWQTLARSINTSISTLLPLVALYFLGAESIQLFVLALIVGILAGTYSSIFIASPVLTLWQGKRMQ